MNYLQAVESAKDVSEVKPLSNQVRERLNKLRDDALAVIEAQELSTVSVLSEAMFDLSKRVVLEGLEPIEEKLRDAGVGESAFFIPPLTAVGAEPGRVNISMERFQFKPPTITVRVGTTVVWVNNEQPRHTATSDTDIFNSGSMDRGATFEFTLNDVGVVAYFCRFHGDKGGVGMGRDNYSPAIVTLDSGTQQPTPYTLLTNRSPALEGPAAEPGLAHDKVSAHRTESRLSVLCYLA